MLEYGLTQLEELYVNGLDDYEVAEKENNPADAEDEAAMDAGTSSQFAAV